DRGRLEEVKPWLAAAAGEWSGLLAALHRFKSGDLPSREEGLGWVAEAAVDAGRSVFWRTVASCLASVTLYWRRALDDVPAAVEHGLALAEADANFVAQSYLLGYGAAAELELGESAAAAETLDRAEDLRRRRPELEEHFTASVAHVARGRMLEGTAAEHE